MTTATTPRELYIQRILDLYRRAPGTTGQIRRCDRRLAAELHDGRVPFSIVRTAFVLAIARRTFRSADKAALPPIATLFYFRPVIDELLADPPDPSYVAYLEAKLATTAPALITTENHQLS